MNKLLLHAIVIVVIVGLVIWYMQMGKSAYSPANYYGTQPTTTTVAPTTTTSTAQTTGDVATIKTDPKKGSYLVGPNGMTLYIFDGDTSGTSNCTGSCTSLWIPYTTTQIPSNMVANYATLQRADNTTQFSFKGKPLYYFVNDKQPGDMTGDGYAGVWHVAKP